MRLTWAKIIDQQEITPGYYRMVLEASAIAEEAIAGQFLHIRVSKEFEPLLRRPFSIHRVRNHRSEVGQIEILYKVVGRGTELLSKKKPGEELDILGPLGRGFYLCEPSHYPLLVAGGVGVAPLLFLTEELLIHHPSSHITILLGAETKEEILCKEEFEGLGVEVKIATDDGSYGHRGSVIELLPLTTCHLPLAIYACGPLPMLREVAKFAREHNLPCQVSLESYIACGLGACLGCVIKTIHHYKRVCKDGPVFEASEVVWDDRD